MKIKLKENQYKKLLREFTEVMVMCTPWKRCMEDPYGENEKTRWFVGRLEYNENADNWFPYSQDSNMYRTRDEATQAYFDGFYSKEPLMEMRFDGKSTGLFSEEEPVNEFFGEKVKSYAKDKKEDVKKFWKNLVKGAKRERKETADAVKILGKLLSGKEKPTEEEIKFLKNQSADIAKIIGVTALGVVSTAIPIAIEAMLKKSGYDISILPKDQSKILDGDEDGDQIPDRLDLDSDGDGDIDNID